MKSLNDILPDDVEKKWDEDLKQNYVEYTEDGNKKQVWIEDLDSLKAKISLIMDHNLAGIGCWQKGMETDDVWGMIKEALD